MERKIIGVVDISPSTNLIKVLANAGYTIEAAVADIVDNSISHHAKRIDVNFVHKGKQSYVEIVDDGEGMNDQVLQKAMAFADKSLYDARSVEDLGRYGVGMKTASSSFCDTLQVISKGSNGEINSYWFPFTEKEWKIYKIGTNPDDIKTTTGTRVIWHNLKLANDEKENERILTSDVDAFVNIVDRVESHLSKVFGLLINKNLKIVVNGNTLIGWSPFSIPGLDVSTIYDDSSFVIANQKVHVKAFLLPVADHMSKKQFDYATYDGSRRLADYEGFYVYRNNRMIVCGGWLNIPGLGIGEKFNYARVGIWFEPSVDADRYLRVNFIKDSINPPVDFSKYLLKSAKLARSKSSNSYDYKKNPRPYKRKGKEDDIPVWDVTRKEHSSTFSINQNHPLVQKYTEGMDKRKVKALFNLLAKEFPFRELEDCAPKVDLYSDEDLQSMLNEAFSQEMKIKGTTVEQAMAKIIKEKPFCDEKYKGKCILMLANMVGGINDGK
jgi:anti-sigma regulatory factor (Ser/Thr protein kinase)